MKLSDIKENSMLYGGGPYEKTVDCNHIGTEIHHTCFMTGEECVPTVHCAEWYKGGTSCQKGTKKEVCQDCGVEL